MLTGGVGDTRGRSGAAGGLWLHLGVAVDPDRNQETTADGDISAPDAAVRTVVVTAREDLEIRRQVLAVLGEARDAR